MRRLIRTLLARRRVAVVIVISLTSAACAGSVGKYRDATPLSGGLGVPASPGADGSFAVDPETGALIDPETGALIDPETGAVIGADTRAAAGTPVSSEGNTGASSSTAGIGSTTGVTKDSITIGLFYPKTGAAASLFVRAPDVVQAALDEAGRIHGRKLILKTYDDGSQDAQIIQAEEKRAKDEVFLYLSLLADTNEILGPLANQHGVPTLLAGMSEEAARPLRYVFVITTYLTREAAIAPGFIKNYLKAANKRIGIVSEGTTSSRHVASVFKAKARAMGLKIVFEQTIGTFQSSCANEVSNFQANNVELVFMHNSLFGAICMLRDAHAVGYKPIWTGVGPYWNLNVVPQAVGRDAANGIRMISSLTTLETRAGRHFAQLMRKTGNGGAAEDDIMLYYYALALHGLEALRRTGPALGREAFVRTYETKMNGFNSGYLPPPHFAPGQRPGPQGTNVTACCSNNNWWFSEQTQWRSRY